MSQYLIVAEVDKIQSFIFRSSRLREVAGASYLLEQLCQEIGAKYANDKNKDVLSSAGGSFRIVVDEAGIDETKSYLKRHFEERIGGSITVTCVPFSSEGDVIKRGNAQLRRAKLEGDNPEPLWHSPYHAICASSGEELAVVYESPGGRLQNGQARFPDERPRYMGQTTLKKGDEAAAINLVDKFISRMDNPEIEKLPNPTEADTYAQFDPRQYVAYMVSDGNGMGEIFNKCKPDQLRELSSKIGGITSDALLQASVGMCAETYSNGQMRFPILPLISGGDDLFVLMPAPWSVDVAIKFTQAYQAGMTAQLSSMGLLKEREQATTGAAVVICKASYPYRAVYQYAHELLGIAKKQAKTVQQSCLIADFVVGSDTVVSDRIKPHPYTFEEAQYFVDHRFALRGLPSRILHQIENALLQQQNTAPIVERVKQLYPRLGYDEALQKALKESSRLGELLKLWDFCYDMAQSRTAYLPEER